MMEYSVEERERAALQLASLVVTGVRPGTLQMVARAWAGGEDVKAIYTSDAMNLQCLANRQAAEIERLRGRVEEAMKLIISADSCDPSAESPLTPRQWWRERYRWLSVSASQGVEG